MNQPQALLSVSDKTGIVAFAEALLSQGFTLLSTGGTAQMLRDAGLVVTDVSDHTGFPEVMGGRVKTLHPHIHGGILARRGIDDDVLVEHHISTIDLVVVNLYPFESAVSDPDCTFDNAVENIDIGGPAMLRAAAKNHASVTVVTNPLDYDRVVGALAKDQSEELQALRLDLAVRAFEHTARYDGMIASYFGSRLNTATTSEVQTFSRTLNLQLTKVEDLRYGENPHQSAAFYKESPTPAGTVSAATQEQGKALSYNNIADTDAALECVRQFEHPACVIVKHANPCGVGESPSGQLLDAYELAYNTDPTSAFGGIIAFNRAVDAALAKAIVDRQFVEVVIAPGFSAGALTAFSQRENVRVLDCGELGQPDEGLHYARVAGGLLVQQRDLVLFGSDDLKVVTKQVPDKSQMADLIFAWKVAKFVKSNAIVYARSGQTIGIGAGQMSRVYSARIAAIKASDENLEVVGAVMASDAFFPFRDGIDSAAEHGISAVIQPGGSKNDQQVIDAADEHGIAMVFTGMRHFRH